MGTVKELVVATTNKKKKKELVALLKGLRLKILGLSDFKGIPKVKEDKKTFKGNAVKKARTISRITKGLTLAEDSGLEVKALDGLPGVRSARFAGLDQGDRKNNEKLLRLLKGVPFRKRKARYVCVAALADNGKLAATASGAVSGYISLAPKGKSGFGYDPVFYYPPFGKNFAEVSTIIKNRISHRYKALRKVKKILQEVL